MFVHVIIVERRQVANGQTNFVVKRTQNVRFYFDGSLVHFFGFLKIKTDLLQGLYFAQAFLLHIWSWFDRAVQDFRNVWPSAHLPHRMLPMTTAALIDAIVQLRPAIDYYLCVAKMFSLRGIK